MATADVYQDLAARHGLENSERYRRILQFVMTPKQAELVAVLPGTYEELAEKTGLDPSAVEQELSVLFKKGVVFPADLATLDRWHFAGGVDRLHDTTQVLGEIDVFSADEKRQILALWEDFCENEWNEQLARAFATVGHPPIRVIPAHQSIAHLPGVLPEENMAELFKAQQSIAVIDCVCRLRRSETGNPCTKSAPHHTCFQLNRWADWVVARGHGRTVSYDEAMEILHKAEDDFLVHIWPNGPAMTTRISCHCCGDCCLWIHPMHQRQLPHAAFCEKSRYEPQLDNDQCTGCGNCVDSCSFDAITLPGAGDDGPNILLNAEKCMGCGVCTLACPLDAIEMRCVRPPEHVLAAPLGHTAGDQQDLWNL